MSVEFMVEDVKPGRICQGRSHHGNAPDLVYLRLSFRRIYQLREFIEDEIPKGGKFSDVKGLCCLHERLEASMKPYRTEMVMLEIPGQMLFEFQRYLEDQIRKGGDFFRARWLVVLYEEVRLAYVGGDVTDDVGT